MAKDYTYNNRITFHSNGEITGYSDYTKIPLLAWKGFYECQLDNTKQCNRGDISKSVDDLTKTIENIDKKIASGETVWR